VLRPFNPMNVKGTIIEPLEQSMNGLNSLWTGWTVY